ncbi:hypothetical protein KIL84_020709 [Mauremys mutica]|uniref:C-type lectin domain-containing protein n=1 Tax=Mauremys mutica TaxID=74926 RepID=A0A9D3XB48_9SAUR|nr:hypothetical protein KIL84_020709 [Mauremys mutica]
MQLSQTKRAKMPHGRPDSMGSFEDDCERDYENIDPNQPPPQPQMQPQWQAKAEPAVSTPKAAEQRGCGRKSLGILYALVGVSLLVSTAAFLLILLKYPTDAKQEQTHPDNNLRCGGRETVCLRPELCNHSPWHTRSSPKQDDRLLRGRTGIPCCPHGWEEFQKKCYFFSLEKEPWEMARNSCSTHSAELVVISNPWEQAFLTVGINSVHHWIGLSHKGAEGNWTWVDGSQVSYRSSGIPSVNTQKCCVHLTGDDRGNWSSADCGIHYNFICERAGPFCV